MWGHRFGLSSLPRKSMQTHRRLACTTALVIWGAACAIQESATECVGDLHENDLIELETVEIDLEDVCGGSIRAAKEHAIWVSDVWGVPSQPVHYRLFGNRDSACWPCSSFAAACARIGELSSTQIPDRHELTHAARGVLCSSAILEEGWAMRFGDPGLISSTVGDLRAMIEAEAQAGPLPGQYYPVAARLTGHLEAEYGTGIVKELCLQSLNSVEAWDSALQAAVGQSFDEFEDELDQQGAYTLAQYRRERSCEDGSGTNFTPPATWEVRLDCAAEDVEGRRDVKVWAQQLIRIEVSSSYSINLVSTSNVELIIEVESCDRDGPVSAHYSMNRGMPGEDLSTEVTLGELAVGTYVVRFLHEGPEVPGLVLTANIQ